MLVVDGKIQALQGVAAKTYQNLKELRRDLSEAFKSINIRFNDIEHQIIEAHKELDNLSRSVAEIQLTQDMTRLDIRRTELSSIYGKDIMRLYVLKERYERLVQNLHEAESDRNAT